MMTSRTTINDGGSRCLSIRLRTFLATLFAVCGALGAGQALAACTVSTEFRPTLPGTINVPGNGGQVGRAISGWTSGGFVAATCTNQQIQRYFSAAPSATEVMRYSEGGDEYSVFATGVAGIGMVISMSEHSNTGRKPLRSGETTQVWADHHWGYPSDFTAAGYMRIRFIKTGPISTGRQPVTERALGRGSYGPTWAPLSLPALSLNVVNNPTCRVLTSRVPMGHRPIAAFVGSGSGPGRVTPVTEFNLDLSCEANVGRVEYEFLADDDRILDLANAVLKLDNPADLTTARGVGLQLLNAASTPVKFRESVHFSTSNAAGLRRKVHRARYYQLGTAPPQPGIANATVDVLLVYP